MISVFARHCSMQWIDKLLWMLCLWDFRLLPPGRTPLRLTHAFVDPATVRVYVEGRLWTPGEDYNVRSRTGIVKTPVVSCTCSMVTVISPAPGPETQPME